jgi:hypothetical protein
MATETVSGVPWLSSRAERAIFDEIKYACVYAVGPSGGRPLRLGWSRYPLERVRQLQQGNWKELTLHDLTWTAGDIVATRLLGDTERILDLAKRRIHGDWFDVTPELASQTIRVASSNLNIPTFTHSEMLEKVRSVRKKRIDAAVRASGL